MTRREFLSALGGAVAAASVPGVVKAMLPTSQVVPAAAVTKAVYVSDEVMEDAVIDILKIMREEMVQGMSRALDDAVLNGVGPGLGGVSSGHYGTTECGDHGPACWL